MKKLFIAIAIIALAAPAMAGDWNLYGSARMQSWYDVVDKDASGLGEDDTDLTYGLQGNSRIGAKVTAGALGGLFEYGTGVNVRRLFGTYDFGGAQLLVGQEYTPVDFCYSSQVGFGDNGLNYYGTTFSRKPMIQLTMSGFKIALVQPSTTKAPGDFGVTAASLGIELPPWATLDDVLDDMGVKLDTDSLMPAIEARYDFSMEAFSAAVMGGYSQYKLTAYFDGDEAEETVSMYIVGVGGSANVGPATIAAQFVYGQNLGIYDLCVTGGDASPNILIDLEDESYSFKDNTGYGYAVDVSFAVSDTITLALGYGAASFEDDVKGAERDDEVSYFINAKINLADGVFIQPEVGVFDHRDDGDGNEEGKETYFGAKWQINF